MSSLSRKSFAKTFGNWPRGENFRPKKPNGGGGSTNPPASLRVKLAGHFAKHIQARGGGFLGEDFAKHIQARGGSWGGSLNPPRILKRLIISTCPLACN